MDAKLISSRNVMVSASRERRLTMVHVWTTAAILGSTVSVLCFVLATTLSILTFAGIIVAPTIAAYFTVTALMAAFICAFFAAHALDKLAVMVHQKIADE